MLLNIIVALGMAVLAVYMMGKGTLCQTRRMAWIPLAVCGMELLTAGLLTPADFPVLTVLLVLLRLTIAGCCAAALRYDAAAARAKRRRRERLSRELRTALHPLHALPGSAPQRVRRTGDFHCA